MINAGLRARLALDAAEDTPEARDHKSEPLPVRRNGRGKATEKASHGLTRHRYTPGGSGCWGLFPERGKPSSQAGDGERVRWTQAATGRVAAALFRWKSLQSLLRGGILNRWSRSRGPRGRPAGKDRSKGQLRPQKDAHLGKIG